MTRQQRFKYEMFIRVRDFGAGHAALFPDGSKGREAFARVAAALTTIDDRQKDHMLGLAEARRVKKATRDAVYTCMKTIATAARRVTKGEPSELKFVLPRKRRVSAELSAARLFLESAAARKQDFERFALPPNFLPEFQARVDELQQASELRISSRTVRSRAQAGTSEALAEGLDACRDLDVIVALTTSNSDPSTFAAWQTARRIDVWAPSQSQRELTSPPPAPVAPASAPTSSPVADLAKAS